MAEAGEEEAAVEVEVEVVTEVAAGEVVAAVARVRRVAPAPLALAPRGLALARPAPRDRRRRAQVTLVLVTPVLGEAKVDAGPTGDLAEAARKGTGNRKRTSCLALKPVYPAMSLAFRSIHRAIRPFTAFALSMKKAG